MQAQSGGLLGCPACKQPLPSRTSCSCHPILSCFLNLFSLVASLEGAEISRAELPKRMHDVDHLRPACMSTA